MIDASPAPEAVAQRIHKKLSREFFSYNAQACPAFQGMEHLTDELREGSGITTPENALQKLKEWQVEKGAHPNFVERVQRVEIAFRLNPGIINPELPESNKRLYRQLLYDFAGILAVSLADLREPARVEPMHIRTFG